jgi:two-component system, NarL family, nitrate/nitrite response regulator NarL
MGGQLVAAALKRCRHNFEVVAFPSTSSDAIRELKASNPQVALISAQLQDGPLTGFKVLHELRVSQMRTAAVMLLDTLDRELVIDAFRAGARGVFSRTQPLRALSKCIRSVYEGQIWIGNNELEHLLQLITQMRPPQLVRSEQMNMLTQREREAVCMVAEGMNNGEIAVKMGVSEHTVRNYIFRIFEKVGVSNRVELVLYALSRPEA